LLQSIRDGNQERVFVKRMDVQDLSNIESVCNELVNQIGGLDLLVISAGIGEKNEGVT
jgi:short-subunit dehydrogenase